MNNPISALIGLWRRPKSVVLDLRPLQCGYARKGIGRYTHEIAHRIADAARIEAQKKRPRYKVSSLVRANRENPVPGIPVLLTAPPWQRPWLWDQVVLPILLLRNRVRIFHNFVTLGPLQEVSFPMLYAFRGLATLHDWHMFAEDGGNLDKFYRNTIRIRLQKKRLPRLRRIVVDAEQIKVDTMLLGRVDAHRITVVPLGGDHFDSIEPESWHMENFVLSIGDAPTKNLPLAYAAISRLRAKFVHLNWVIIGNRQNIEACLAPVRGTPGFENGILPPWISILENPTDAKLKACYQKALCLLFPSTREGFGIPVLEAMRLGCPVLASDIEPLKSLLGYPPGQLSPTDPIPWSEAINKLLFFPDARAAAITHGRARASQYTWDQTTTALLNLYLS
ncbi:MAG: Mannosyltransferase 2 [Fibrobacteres bacterium]|nr:Mannosyltransferase 2 [Fibrobacterota bacterium]